MKQPSGTVPPLVGPNTEKRSLWDLFRSSGRRDAFYEAYSRRGDLYLLWMECARFGVRMAYLEQLRWCGCKKHAGAIQVVASACTSKAVRDFANVVVRELSR